MSIQASLSSDLDEILKDGRTRDAGLADEDATPAENNVVSDLYEIIDARTGADHRVSRRSSINRRIGANLDIVFENHPTKLGPRQEPGFGGDKSKSFLPDPRAGIDVYARSQ
jgi:hypothetical protein